MFLLFPVLIFTLLLTVILLFRRSDSAALSSTGLLKEASISIRSYPVFMAFSLCATFLTLILIWFESKGTEAWQLLVALLFGLPLTLALDAFSYGRSRVLPYLALPIVGLVYNLQLNEPTHTFTIRWVQLFLCAHLLVSFSRHTKSSSQVEFWSFNKGFFICFLLATAYSSFIAIGLFIATGVTFYLFEISSEWFKIYVSIFACSSLFLHPLLFIGFIRGSKTMERPDPEDRRDALIIFARFVLIPLVLLYLFILLCYELKIAITWELPKGMVGWLICTFGSAGTLAWLLAYPFSDQKRGVLRFYHRHYFHLLIPLLVLLSLAVYERISAYGLTELRFFLLLLTVWITTITILFSVKRDAPLKIIPLSLFILTAVTMYGPLSAFSVSFRSQFARLEKHLFSKIGCQSGIAEKLPLTDVKEASSILTYLVDTHPQPTFSRLTQACQGNRTAIKVLDDFQSTHFQTNFRFIDFQSDAWSFTDSFLDSLDITAIRPSYSPLGDANSFYYTVRDQQDAINVSGLDELISNLYINSHADNFISLSDGRKVGFKLNDLILSISLANEVILVLDLEPPLREVEAGLGKSYSNSLVPPEKLLITKSARDYTMRFYIRQISGSKKDGKHTTASYLNGAFGLALPK